MVAVELMALGLMVVAVKMGWQQNQENSLLTASTGTRASVVPSVLRISFLRVLGSPASP